jgi:hypothetical protein
MIISELKNRKRKHAELPNAPRSRFTTRKTPKTCNDAVDFEAFAKQMLRELAKADAVRS